MNVHPAPERRTNKATINWTNMPTMTVCHFTAFLCLDVAHMTKILDDPSKQQKKTPGGFVSHYSKAEKANGAVISSVVHTLWACKATDQDHPDDYCRTRRDLQLLGDEADNPEGRVVPHEVHWFGDDCYRYV